MQSQKTCKKTQKICTFGFVKIKKTMSPKSNRAHSGSHQLHKKADEATRNLVFNPFSYFMADDRQQNSRVRWWVDKKNTILVEKESAC